MYTLKELAGKILIRIIKQNGYSDYSAYDIYERFRNDFHYRKNIGILNLLKAYKFGFSATFFHKLANAGIPHNECIPDLSYNKLHPINKQFSHLIDDKLTLAYILSKHSEFIPSYYCYIGDALVYSLIDYPENLNCDVKGIVELLEHKQELAVKPNAGTGSIGFSKLAFCDEEFYINDKNVSRNELIDFLSSLRDYLITEFVHAHSFLKAIYPDSSNMVRLMVVNNTGKDPILVASYMRLGQKATGFTELTPDGGIFCGVDLTTGELFDAMNFKGPIVERIEKHPDTDATIEGYIPHWDNIIGKIKEMCLHIPTLSYLGFDIIVTDSSFKVIEINSLSGISYIQLYYPLLRNHEVKQLLKSL